MLACLATLFFAVAKVHFLAFVVLVKEPLLGVADLVASDLELAELELMVWKPLLKLGEQLEH